MNIGKENFTLRNEHVMIPAEFPNFQIIMMMAVNILSHIHKKGLFHIQTTNTNHKSMKKGNVSIIYYKLAVNNC